MFKSYENSNSLQPSDEIHEGGDKKEGIELADATEKSGLTGRASDKSTNEELTARDIEKIMFFELVQMESEPTFWARLVTKVPFCCCLLSYIIMAIFFLACIGEEFYQFDKPHHRDYLIWDDPITKSWDMRTAGMKYIDERDTRQIAERFVPMDDWSVTFVYEGGDNSLLGNLKAIHDFEAEVGKAAWDTVCRAKALDDSSCADDYFSGALELFEANDLDVAAGPTADKAKAKLDEVKGDETVWDKYRSRFQKDVDSANVAYMRTSIKVGAPLKGFKSQSDKPEEQKKKITDFYETIQKTVDTWNEKNNGVKYYMHSPVMKDLVFEEVVRADVTWLLMSIVFSGLWILFHTMSIFISFVAFSVLICTVPATLVICEGVFQITYLGGLHLLCVYIVIAVCLNNVLVIYDTWNQTTNLTPLIFDPRGSGRLDRRMSFVLRRASRGMFMTSITTALALFGHAWSPVMPISSVSVFAGVSIIVNFFFVLMVIPPTLAMHAKFERACCKRKEKDAQIRKSRSHRLDDQYSMLDKFFGDKWNWVTSNVVIRILIFVIFIGWTGFASYKALDIEFKTYIEEFIPESHDYMMAESIIDNNFTSTKNARIYFVWGVNDIDNSDLSSKWDSRQIGKSVMDRTFDPIDEETFDKLEEFCTDLGEQKDLVESVDCWVSDLRQWTQQRGISWVPPNKYAAQNYFIKWLETTEAGKSARDYGKLGVIDGRINFMQISAVSKTVRYDNDMTLKLVEYDKWEKFTQKWQAKLPLTAKSMIQTSFEAWSWIPTQETITDKSVNGIIVAASFCFIIILFTSQNIVITIMAVLCLYSVFVSLVTVLVFAKWPMGISEVITMIIVMGLSVDNTIHIAHDYTFAANLTRNGKMRQAYLQKGKTTTSASLALICAAAFLFGTEMRIFNNYARAIIGTIAISWGMSMIGFGAMCHLFGPSSGCGDLCGRLPGKEHEEELEMIRIKDEMQV